MGLAGVVSGWWPSSSSPRYTPLRQNSLSDAHADGILNAMADHTTKVKSATDIVDLEAATPPTPVSAIKYLANGTRRRPLLLSALGAVLLFSTVVLGTFYTYTHYMPEIPMTASSSEDDNGDVWEPELPQSVPPEPYHDSAVVLDNDPNHVLVPVEPLADPPTLLKPMDSRPPLDLLSFYYETGTLAPKSTRYTPPKIDAVYLWVNASSPYFGPARMTKAQEEGIPSLKGAERHWRDNGELRGAVRSAAEYLGRHLDTIHLVSAAFDLGGLSDDGLPELPEGATGWRMGQIPGWLDWKRKGNLHWHFHPEIFRLPRDNGAVPPALADVDEHEWRAKALPTFNSFEIENRMGFLNDLGEQFIMSNDDMFVLRDLSKEDFHHPLFGMVARLDSGVEVKPQVTPNLLSSSGEWGGLQHANLLISQRFPSRKRPYMHHLPKALTRSLVHEATVMFAPSLTDAATRAFRESRRGRADVEMSWLVTNLQIERWREALLWTWIVAKVGGVDGTWGPESREALLAALGVDDDWSTTSRDQPLLVVRVQIQPRSTLEDMTNIERKAGWEGPKATEYLFSSFDGHIPEHPPLSREQKAAREEARERTAAPGKFRRPKGQSYSQQISVAKLRDPETECKFIINECLPAGFFDNEEVTYAATDIFKRLAFRHPACGDCLISALVNRSGPRGLGAFLPSPNVQYVPPASRERHMWDRPEPMLPLVEKWEDGEFGINDVVRLGQDKWHGGETAADSVNLRNWCVKLLSRYSYVYSSTPSRFAMARTHLQLAGTLKDVEKSHDLALFCLNDDQPDVLRNPDSSLLQHWMKRMFGGASTFVGWENDDAWDSRERDGGAMS